MGHHPVSLNPRGFLEEMELAERASPGHSREARHSQGLWQTWVAVRFQWLWPLLDFQAPLGARCVTSKGRSLSGHPPPQLTPHTCTQTLQP